MKVAKGVVLLLACLAMALSIAPVIAQDDVQDLGSGGTSSGGWKVTCTYNGQEQLISKVCSSGGSSTCWCP